MKHIFQVFKFEYLSCIKNKAFIAVTIILIAMILLMSFLPAIIMSIATSSGESDETEEKPVIAVCNTAYKDNKLIKDEFSAAYSDYDIKITDENTSQIEEKVDSQDYDFAVIIDQPLSYTYITRNNSMFDETSMTVSEIIKSIYKINALSEYGLSSEQAGKILNVDVTSKTVSTGTDQTKNYISTYVLIMVLYMAIIMYGQLVSNSVITEKNSRAMEMLITCAKPSHLMFGKVIGSGLAGLTQLVLIAAVGVASVSTITASSLPNEISSFISFPVSTVIYALIFFILGYFIYAFLLAALSSLASRSEDLNTLITPVMLLFVIAFIIVIVSLNSGSVDSILMIVCSYIPFTAPIAMFTRIAMSNVAFWEILLSIGIQVVSIYLLGLLAAAIYRLGVLMYGKPPKLSEIFGLLKEQHNANKKIKQSN
ncbi:MAG: ABC transporter permease [Clostridia bacterium]|nr:ABC transporter permease [Clostridia bacterium]